MDDTQFNAERFNADERIAVLERQLRGDFTTFFDTEKTRNKLLGSKINELEIKLKALNKSYNERLDEVIKLKKENADLDSKVIALETAVANLTPKQEASSISCGANLVKK